jgi:hypothetical protein
MAVSIRGQAYDNEGDGLAGLLAAHVAAHRENGDKILNLNDAAIARAKGEVGPKINDPRPRYVYQPFPAHVHHADGRTRVVASPDEKTAALDSGFRAEPYRVVKAAVLSPEVEKAALQAKLAESDGKIASQNDLLQKLMDQVAALVKANKAK